MLGFLEPKEPRKSDSVCSPAWSTDSQIPTWTRRLSVSRLPRGKHGFNLNGPGEGSKVEKNYQRRWRMAAAMERQIQRETQASSSTRLPSFHAMCGPLTISDWPCVYLCDGSMPYLTQWTSSLPVGTWLSILFLCYFFGKEIVHARKYIFIICSVNASSYLVTY
jgi:hypothetical protein